MRKFLAFFSSHVSTSLSYRAELISLVIKELISVGGILVMWFAIYRSQSEVGGYGFQELILYYLLIPLAGFVTQIQLSNQVGAEIKDGNLSLQLLKPYRIWAGLLARTLAGKLSFVVIVVPLYVSVIVWYYHWANLRVSWLGILIALCIAVCALLMHFCLDVLISWVAFWVDDVWSFKFFKELAIGILGGVSFPLEFLPAHLRYAFEFLPFKYFYYVPINYFLGKGLLNNLWVDVLSIGFWCGVFLLIATFLWKLGLVKYEAYGH